MLERFKRGDRDRTRSGPAATADPAQEREERARAREARRAEAAARSESTGRFRRDPDASTAPAGAVRPSDAGTVPGDPASTRGAEESDAARSGATTRRFDESEARDREGAGTGRLEPSDATRVRDDDLGETTARRGDAGAAAAHDDRTEEQTAARGILTKDALKTARARQRDEFGGLNWGASFFGWLVAVGVAAIITGLLAAAGAAIGLTSVDTADVESIGLGGGIALLAALMLAYYCGGYVAGRMSRFDGARQGIGVWLIALAVTAALALLAVVAGEDYNVLAQLNLPSLPVGESELRSGGWIALVAIVAGTFLAALVGGKAGERFHRRVDRAGFVD